MLYWNGVQSDSSIVVCARSTANGTVTLSVSGQTDVTATAATSTNDGVVRLEMTGLTANRLYNYTVTTPNDSGTGEVKTFPSDGAVKIAVVSCHDHDMFPAITMLNDDPLIVVHLGDETYRESNSDNFGTKSNATTLAGHHAFRLETRSSSFQKQKVLHRIGFARVVDDHDSFINNHMDDLTQTSADSNTERGYTITAGEFTTIKAHTGDSAYSYLQGNPVTTSSDTDPFYFSFVCGNVEVFVLSQVLPYRGGVRPQKDPVTDPLLNANQWSWLQAALSASTKTFKLICSPKATRGATNLNSDTWSEYNDLDIVLQWVHDNVTGVMFVCGDWHSPTLAATTNGVDSETYDHVTFIASPAATVNGNTMDINDPGALTSETKWVIPMPEGENNGRFQCYGLFESAADGSYIDGKLIPVGGGVPLCQGRVLAGENKLNYPTTSVAI